MDREFLTADELAAIFSCHCETVKRMARTGQLPGFKFGRRWFFPKTQLNDLLARLSSASHLRRDKE
jgi:excisionase family DNA binding protein